MRNIIIKVKVGCLLVAAVKIQGLCKGGRVCTISGSFLELCKKMPASTKAATTDFAPCIHPGSMPLTYGETRMMFFTGVERGGQALLHLMCEMTGNSAIGSSTAYKPSRKAWIMNRHCRALLT